MFIWLPNTWSAGVWINLNHIANTESDQGDMIVHLVGGKEIRVSDAADRRDLEYALQSVAISTPFARTGGR